MINSQAQIFIDGVLRLRPRLAAFDCDGTLWASDAGEGFFEWELQRKLVADDVIDWARARYTDYRAGAVEESTMCGEMVTMHRGLMEAELMAAAAEYFDSEFRHNIFPEMQELVRRLHEDGCEVWAVSSSNEWVIRAAMTHFGIPEGRILASRARLRDGRVTGELIIIPSGEDKPRAIQDACGRTADAAFGNSIWDEAMLASARHPFTVNPKPDFLKIAVKSGWPIYWPEGTAPIAPSNP
jgi:phosphoserine phosphatase